MFRTPATKRSLICCIHSILPELSMGERPPSLLCSESRDGCDLAARLGPILDRAGQPRKSPPLPHWPCSHSVIKTTPHTPWEYGRCAAHWMFSSAVLVGTYRLGYPMALNKHGAFNLRNRAPGTGRFGPPTKETVRVLRFGAATSPATKLNPESCFTHTVSAPACLCAFDETEDAPSSAETGSAACGGWDLISNSLASGVGWCASIYH